MTEETDSAAMSPPPELDEPGADDRSDDGYLGSRPPSDYLWYTALVVLAVLAVVATFQLYGSTGAIINTFVADRFQPVFNAFRDLAVLLLTVAGIVFVLRRLRDRVRNR